jgi:hypothetical protein
MTLETFFEKFDQFADAPDTGVKMGERWVAWGGRLRFDEGMFETKGL